PYAFANPLSTSAVVSNSAWALGSATLPTSARACWATSSSIFLILLMWWRGSPGAFCLTLAMVSPSFRARGRERQSLDVCKPHAVRFHAAGGALWKHDERGQSLALLGKRDGFVSCCGRQRQVTHLPARFKVSAMMPGRSLSGNSCGRV